jgi:hypothetical protein
VAIGRLDLSASDGRGERQTYPSKRSLQTVKTKVRQITKHTGPDQAPDQLLHRVNRVLRGWCNYFRHGVSSATFGSRRHYAYSRLSMGADLSGCDQPDHITGSGSGPGKRTDSKDR